MSNLDLAIDCVYAAILGVFVAVLASLFFDYI